jgi:hypothetical protein
VELRARETSKGAAERAARELGLEVRLGKRLASFTHAITRFRIAFEAFEAMLDGAKGAKGAKRVRLAALESLAMPAPHRKLARLLGRAKDEA